MEDDEGVGAVRSFESVYGRHRDWAVRLAYLLLSDPEDAEDAVATAFAKVLRRWRRGGIDDVRAYLRQAVVNETRSSLRRRYRRRFHRSRRHGDRRGVRLAEEQAADRDAVWQAIGRLPTRQRQAVVLRYYEELSVAETAAVLGVVEGTVKSQVSRALDKLQDWLDTDGGMGEGTVR